MSFDLLAGIYVYCADYHEGQWSRLYRLMSRIKMHLSDTAWKAIRHGRDDPYNEWETARIVYRSLKRKGSK
jgi:hypothetical protein